jgi:arginine/lysine/ornithine decarboxylase
VEKNPHIREDIRKYLSFVMSSSPSYVLLASLELAVTDAAKAAGAEAGSFATYAERIKNFRKKCEKLENLRVFAGGEGYDIDITRLVIYQKYVPETAGNRLNGPELEKMLADEGIVVEMSGLDYVVLISSYVDNEADFVDLYAVLEKIDDKIGERLEEITTSECGNMSDTCDEECVSEIRQGKSVHSDNEYSCLEKLKAGDIAQADYYVYPPGIPIIAKGEIITEGALAELKSLGAAGKKIHMS